MGNLFDQTFGPQLGQGVAQGGEAVVSQGAKLLSLLEPHTEIIRKGKSSKPNEFGKLVELQEAENQVITHYEAYEDRPATAPRYFPAWKPIAAN